MPYKEKVRKTKAVGESSKSRHRMEIQGSCSEPEISRPRAARKQSKPGREEHTQNSLDKDEDQDDNQERSLNISTPTMTAKPRRPRSEAASTKPPAFSPEPTQDRKIKRTFEEESNSSTKRQRTTRFNGINPYNFDMKVHKDFDLVMKPGAAATKRARAGRITKTCSDVSDSASKSPKLFVKDTDDDNDNDDDDMETVKRSVYRRGRSNLLELHMLRRSMRSNRATPNYSAKWHPIDDMKGSKRGRVSAPKPKLSKTGLRLSGSPISKASKQRDKDHEKTDYIYATSEDVAYPHRRRSARTTHDAEMAMNYDMHHHASFDSHHRPKEVARRREQRLKSVTMPARDEEPERPSTADLPSRPPSSYAEGSLTPGAEGVLNYSDKDKSLRDGSTESIMAIEAPTSTIAPSATASGLLTDDLRGFSSGLPPLPNVTNACLISKILDWAQLSEFDRRTFLLQRGAPVQGNTLPLEWSTVKQILFDEGFEITLDSVNSTEGTEMIAARYERTRLDLETFFAAEPEPTNQRDWTLFRVEGIDVLDKKRGSKYWKHTEDSIFVPTEIHMENKSHVSIGGDGTSISTVQENDTGQKTIDIRLDEDTLETIKRKDELLAIAEPAEDTSVAYESTQAVGDSSVTLLGDEGISSLLGHFGTPDEAQKYILDVMRISQPAASGITETDHLEVGEIEAFFDPVRPIQDSSAKLTTRVPAKAIEKQDNSAISQPAVQLALSKDLHSKKRKKRKVASDFFNIYEDDAVDKNQPPEQKSPRSDLPIENMLSSHQSSGSSNSHRRRHR